jgi:hypothetical protein
MHITALSVIPKMAATFIQMSEIGCTTQYAESSIWMVTAMRIPTSGMAVDGRVVQYTIYPARVYIPDRLLGSL